MTVGIVFSISRLKKAKIYCISPPRVNMAGRVNLMVFDKTGTLTEDGLQVLGFRGVETAKNNKNRLLFGGFQTEISYYQPTN